MVDTDNDQKTEEPTGKRISDAQQEGQLAISRELATWVMFVSGMIVLAWLGPMLGQKMTGAMRVFLESPHLLSLEGGGLQGVLLGMVSSVAFEAIIVLGLFLGAAILGTMIQTGFYVNTSLIKFDVSKLLSMKGIKGIFSANALMEFAKGFAKMVVMGYVAYLILKPVSRQLPTLVDVPMLQGLAFLHEEVIDVLAILMIIITFIAVGDTLYVRFNYFKGLRMTKQEVRDEHKQMEGDPLVKGRLRRLRMEKARQRMMANVPNADVVITNPTHYAIALQYDNTKMAAPVVVAKGMNKIATRIREMAEEHDVPLVSNPPLARALYDTVDIDEPITPEHYRAVAEVISYVYKIKKKVLN